MQHEYHILKACRPASPGRWAPPGTSPLPASSGLRCRPKGRSCERRYLLRADAAFPDTFLRTWLLGERRFRRSRHARKNAGGEGVGGTLLRSSERGGVFFGASGCPSDIGLIFEIPVSYIHEREMKRSWHAIPAFLRTQPRGIMAPRRGVLAPDTFLRTWLLSIPRFSTPQGVS
jgi:hypothetical protein